MLIYTQDFRKYMGALLTYAFTPSHYLITNVPHLPPPRVYKICVYIRLKTFYELFIWGGGVIEHCAQTFNLHWLNVNTFVKG